MGGRRQFFLVFVDALRRCIFSVSSVPSVAKFSFLLCYEVRAFGHGKRVELGRALRIALQIGQFDLRLLSEMIVEFHDFERVSAKTHAHLCEQAVLVVRPDFEPVEFVLHSDRVQGEILVDIVRTGQQGGKGAAGCFLAHTAMAGVWLLHPVDTLSTCMA